MSEANDFLMAAGVKSAKFPAVGASVTGTIAREPEVQQQRDIKDNSLKFWTDGKPMQQLQVVLATDERDPADADDDGQRAIYVKANMQKAIREAVKASGAPGLKVGGTLTVTFVDEGERKQAGFNPPKLYAATYAPPANAQANEFLAGGEQPAPTPAMAGAPAPAGIDPAALAALATLTPEQKASLGL